MRISQMIDSTENIISQIKNNKKIDYNKLITLILKQQAFILHKLNREEETPDFLKSILK